jgi:hypothetical protein
MGITKIEILIILTVSIALFLSCTEHTLEKKRRDVKKNNFPRKENGYVCKNTLRSKAREQASE